MALPRELTLGQTQALVTDFARSQFIAKGMVADIAIHHAKSGNPHAHILLTTRDITAQGFGPKNRDWNRKEHLQAWRQAWEHHANRTLELAGHVQRIDHRTLKAQGLDRDPTRHLGPAATGYERRTGAPSRCRADMQVDPDTQRKIAALTRDLETTQQRLADLEEAHQGRAQALAEERAEQQSRQIADRLRPTVIAEQQQA